MRKVLKLLRTVSVRVPPHSLLEMGGHLPQIFSLVPKPQFVLDPSVLGLILGCVNGLCILHAPAFNVTT